MPATRRKLSEAQFFFRKLASSDKQVLASEPEAFDCYLSALLSAARSVTFALQAEYKERYDAWFPSWREVLPDDERVLLAHFNEQRVQEVHRTGANVTYGSERISLFEYFARASSQGLQIEVSNGPIGNPPLEFTSLTRAFEIGGNEAAVVRACGNYVSLLTKLVDDFASQFPV